MRTAEGLRGDALIAAFEEALKGKPERFYVQLGIISGLPGTRANLPLAQAFAVECVLRGKVADKLAFDMAEMHPDIAPGASPREFLPMCGVLAIGARAAAEPKLRKRALAVLHDGAEDLRFRVREAVPLALAKIGGKMGDTLVHETATWTDGFFQAAAVLIGMGQAEWLPAITDVDAALARLDEAYQLAKTAPRATWRYPGWKALVDALSVAPAALASRFGVPVFEQLSRWSDTEMPELREAIEKNLRSGNLASRYKDEIAAVHASIKAAIPPPRDPTQKIQGMRSRSKKRGKY